MNLDYIEQIPIDFSNLSRVWIYQSNRIFFDYEALEIETSLKNFVTNWKSHGDPIKGFASLFFGQFIIFIADETNASVSGCSTDTSVHLIKEIEKKFSVNLFNRQNLAFVINDKIEIFSIVQLTDAVENNLISNQTLYFNNTVLTKKELLDKWIITIKDSWLNNKLFKHTQPTL